MTVKVSLQTKQVVYNRLVTEKKATGLSTIIHFGYNFFFFKYMLKICINIKLIDSLPLRHN